MNLDQILRDLGFQERAGLLRAKKVTTNTFRDMDGSAKQIIFMSQKLGLSAEEVVKIKAHIEEKTLVGVDAHTPSDLQRQNQYMRSKQFNAQFTSRQVPNSKSIEFRQAQRNKGQMVFGQKGGLMKQEKVILDYGRKNRIQKIVSGSHAMAQSQNLARKGTQSMSMNMDQYLTSNNGSNHQIKHTNSSVPYSSHPRQKSSDVEPRQTSKSRSPEVFDSNNHTARNHSEKYNESGNQSNVQGSMMAARNQQVNNRQSSVNSDSRQQLSKITTSQNQSQKHSVTFGAPSNGGGGLQSSSGPASASLQNQQNRLQTQMQPKNVDQEIQRQAPKDSTFQDQKIKQLQNQGSFKVPFKQPENHVQRIKTDNHQQPSESNHEQIDSHHQAHLQTKPKIADQNGRDQNLNTKKAINQTLTNNQTNSVIQNEQLQHLGNRHSQDYLSEKLGQLCNKQEEIVKYPQQQQQILQQNTNSNYNKQSEPAATVDKFDAQPFDQNCRVPNQRSDEIDQAPIQKQRHSFEQIDEKEVAVKQQYHPYEPKQPDPPVQRVQSNMNQHDYEKSQQNQQEQSPSASDLEDPDARYDDEVDENNEEMNYEKENDHDMQQYSEEEEQVEDPSEDAELNADDESNSKLSDEPPQPQPQPQPAATFATPTPQASQQNTQMQHHSRPTIGMKQPAQHFIKKYDVPIDQDDVRSIVSDSSSSHEELQTNGNQFEQPAQNQQPYADNIANQNKANNTNSDSQDNSQDEDSEFFQKLTPQQMADSYNQNQIANQQYSKQNNVIENNHPENQSLEDDDQSEDKSLEEDNYDDEEMPDDNEYQRKVQSLHQSRNAQQLWGASRHQIPPNESQQQHLQQPFNTAVNGIESRNIDNEIDKQEQEISDDSSDDSDEDNTENEEVNQKDERQTIVPQIQNSYNTNQAKPYEANAQIQKTNASAFNPVQSQSSQQVATEHDYQKMQRSQLSTIQHQQHSQNNQASQLANIAVYHTLEQQKQNLTKQASEDQQQQIVGPTSNNQISNSSQNTFLDVAAPAETAQLSKHSSLAHSLHRQQLQNSQQQSVKNLHTTSHNGQQQMSQSSVGINLKDQRQKAIYPATNGINGCTISQQSSFHSNIREPHHLMIENDEKSNAQNNQVKQQQAFQAIQQATVAPNSFQQSMAQPNNQQMFEQLHNQLKVQSQGSNFNLSLTQMNANNGVNSQIDTNQKRQEVPSHLQQQQRKQVQQGMLTPQQYSNQAKEYNQQRAGQSGQPNNGNLSSQASQQNQSALHQVNQKAFLQAPSPSTMRNQVNPTMPNKQITSALTNSQNVFNQPIPKQQTRTHETLKVNKETAAQEDLKQLMLDQAIQRAKEQTTREVTERVTNHVTMQVTEDVKYKTTQEVSERVRNQVEQEMSAKHLSKLQNLKDQYEQSAQQQSRQEAKLNHQIGQLESQVIDTSKKLQEQQQLQRSLSDDRTQIEQQIVNLQQKIENKNFELENSKQEKENSQREHTAIVQQLVREQQMDRSNIVILNQKIEKRQEEFDNTEEQLQTLQSQLKMKNDELADERYKQNLLESNIQSMQNNIKDKANQIATLNQQLADLKDQYADIQESKLQIEQKLKEEADEARAELRQTLEDIRKERNQVEIEKADLQKQVDEANKQTQRAVEREIALIKQQRAQSEAPKQEVSSPKHQQIIITDKRSLTPQVQLNQKPSPQILKNGQQSAQTDLISRNSTVNAQSPQRFNQSKEQSSPHFVQGYKDLQLKQERLQQLMQLQQKQDELIKLEQQLKKQKVSQGQQASVCNDSVSQNHVSTKPQQQSPVGIDGKQMHVVMSQSTEQIAKTNEQQDVIGNKQNGFTHMVDLMDDEQDDNEEQDQDDDNLILTSGSKNKMHHIKEESSYLPDCVEQEKNQKKKVVKKVRFHDDEQLNDQASKSTCRPYDSSNPILPENQYSSVNGLMARGSNLTVQGQSVGKKRIRQDNGIDQEINGTDYHQLSQEILSGSLGQDNSSQQFERLDQERDHQDIEMLEGPDAAIRFKQDKPVDRSHTVFNSLTNGNEKLDEEHGAYKRQRLQSNQDQQHLSQKENNGQQQIKERIVTSQLEELDDKDELPVKPAGNRLRKKVFQEDHTNISASGDDIAAEINGKQQRKRRRSSQNRNSAHDSMGPKQGAGNQQQQVQQHARQSANGQTNLSGFVGNQQQRQNGKAVHSKQNQAASNTGQQSGSMEQKMKQIVGSNDQYLKKNPNLMSMIQRIARK